MKYIQKQTQSTPIQGTIVDTLDTSLVENPKNVAPSLDAVLQMQPKDNLLLNGNLKEGIINQQAKASYTIEGVSTILSIDGWLISNGTVTVKEKSVVVQTKSSGYNLYFKQNVNVNNDCILYFHAISVIGTMKLFAYEDGSYKEIDVVKGDNFLNVESGTQTVGLRTISTEATLEWDMAKLEKGYLFTGMPSWNYAIEFAKCWNIFRALKCEQNESIYTGVTDENGILVFPMIITGMFKKPSVNLKDVWVTSTDGQCQQVSVSKVTDNVILLSTKLAKQIVRIYFSTSNGYFYIDSYTY